MIYLLINQAYCDGEMLRRTLHEMYQKMNGSQPVTDQPKSKSSKSSNDEKETKTVDKNRFKRTKGFYYYGSIFDSIKQLIIKLESWDDDPKYPSLSHNVANQLTLSICPAIAVNRLVKTAKSQNVKYKYKSFFNNEKKTPILNKSIDEKIKIKN